MKKLATILFATLLLSTSAAYASKTPKALSTDEHVKEITYDPNQVYEITAGYRIQTVIEFAPDEMVKTRALGDSIAWQTTVSDNTVYVKPVEDNADTNMTVVTSGKNGKRTYYFKLHAAPANKHTAFAIHFVYPQQNNPVGVISSNSNDPHANAIAVDPTKLNFDYGISGDQATIPVTKVFDDGQFTYFLFADKAEIPSFYVVLNDGTEALVNTHRDGQYMVVERTAGQFTLRNGTAHLCVKNTKNSFFNFGSSNPNQYKHNVRPE